MKIESVIEAALFCEAEPLSVQRLKQLFPKDEQPDTEALREALNGLREHYAERGVNLQEVASGFRFQSSQDFATYWQRLHEKKPPRASKSYLETLAIIAYQQPVTRGEIEQVRGVAVNTQLIRSLVDRQWVKCLGYRDVPGKPALYGTTKAFLDAFNLKSLKELPELRALLDFEKADQSVSSQLELSMGAAEVDERATFDGQPDAEDSIEIQFNLNQDEEVENAELDQAYEKAGELFDNCADLFDKANPNKMEDEYEDAEEQGLDVAKSADTQLSEVDGTLSGSAEENAIVEEVVD